MSVPVVACSGIARCGAMLCYQSICAGMFGGFCTTYACLLRLLAQYYRPPVNIFPVFIDCYRQYSFIMGARGGAVPASRKVAGSIWNLPLT
jgi:hypothetical protein